MLGLQSRKCTLFLLRVQFSSVCPLDSMYSRIRGCFMRTCFFCHQDCKRMFVAGHFDHCGGCACSGSDQAPELLFFWGDSAASQLRVVCIFVPFPAGSSASPAAEYFLKGSPKSRVEMSVFHPSKHCPSCRPFQILVVLCTTSLTTERCLAGACNVSGTLKKAQVPSSALISTSQKLRHGLLPSPSLISLLPPITRTGPGTFFAVRA